MAIQTGTSPPTSFRAGDTVRWLSTYTSYPAGTWEVTFYFSRPGHSGDPIKAVATASGAQHSVTLTNAQTSRFGDGGWDWHARAVDQDDGAITIDEGRVTVRPDPAVAVDKSFAEQALEALENSMKADLPTAQESFTIAGEEVSTMPLSQRMTLRNQFRAEVARERDHRRIREGGRRRGGYEVRIG